jgi:RHS repeat-associated protein
VVVNNDRLMSMAGIDYRYDASGNQISTGNKQQRSFNGLNQLVQINVNGKLTQYEYDALGRRSAKITELGRTDFIWDNHQLIGECTLGEYTWYIYQPDTFTPVALIKTGQVYYYHLDQLGTPICLTDDNAQIVWRSQQGVFGQTIEKSDDEHADVDYAGLQDKITNPIRFQGQYFDDESGLHYNRFRYYSPQQARFIHQDPIGLVGGINHYQYAPNHVNWVDPFGLSCKEGLAEIFCYVHRNDSNQPHFAIKVNEVGSEQIGGIDEFEGPSRIVIMHFDPSDVSSDLILKNIITIKVPDVDSAMAYQNECIKGGDAALDRANYESDRLDTPLYNTESQSCLTHVFDVMRAGGREDAPKTSPTNRTTYKLMKSLEKESNEIGSE